MNICLLNDSFPPLIDGVVNVVQNYAQNLLDNGHGAMVATPYYPDAVDDYPYDVVRYPSFDTTKLVGYRAGFPFYSETIDKIGRFSPSIYHSHCPVVSTILARTLREAHPAPLVLTYHTKFDIDISNAVKSRLLQEAACSALVRNIEACDEVWVVSEGAGRNLDSLGYEGSWRIMRNGVDFPKGRPDSDKTAELRKSLGVEDDEPMLLFVGRIMWYKGLRPLLDAVAGLKQAHLKFKMVFVGGGLEFDEVKAYSDQLRLGDCCVFTGPLQDREQLRTYFGAADLFMFLSDFDTNGIVVREAAACGCASVLLEGSAAAEEMTHGQNALLTTDNPAAVSALLGSLIKDRAALRSLGERAMNELYYSWADSVAAATDRYAQINDDYLSGKLQLKSRPTDQIFDAAADIQEAIENAHARRARILKHIKDGEPFDRFER